ncbi:MAG: hypothetical protein IPK75_18915 [Acidobacteria bacterium]|nr:hypothetical protein [Acidobacteriota bacterium]
MRAAKAIEPKTPDVLQAIKEAQDRLSVMRPEDSPGARRAFAGLAEEVDRFAEHPGTARTLGRQMREGMSGLFRRNGVPSNITIIEKQNARDMAFFKAWAYTPQAAFSPWPELAALQRLAVSLELRMSEFSNRLNKDLDAIKAVLSKDQFTMLGDLLFLGDAETRILTREEMAEAGADAATIKAYGDTRKLLTRVGRLVDFHNRSMLPQLRARKFALVRRAAELTNRKAEDYNRMYNQRAKLRQQLRDGKGNPEKIGDRIDKIEDEWRGRREKMDDRLLEVMKELDTIEAKLAATSVRRIEGYMPHRFFGTWAVYRIVPGEDGAEPTRQLVAGKNGFFPSQDAAVKGAKALLKDEPDAQLRVQYVEFSYPSPEATALTDAGYFRFLGDVGKITGLEGQELLDAVKGVARRPFRRRIAAFALHRKGIQGYSRDLDSVLRSHISQAVRYVILDKLKYEAVTTMERMGLSPNRSANLQTQVLQDAVQAFLRDVNGQKQPIEKQIDSGLFDRPWAKAWRLGLSAGALTALGTVGIAGNPMIAGILGSYVGFRFYRAASSRGSFPTRALMGSFTSDMAHLSLGMVFNLYSAIANLSQTAINTYPLLGERWTTAGISRAIGATRSKMAGRPNRYYRLLQRADVVSQWKYSEVTPNFFRKESSWRAVSMWAFNGAEGFNRAVAFLGAYERAIAAGSSEGAAFRAGREMIVRTQHHYGPANKPAILRQIVLALPAQFKNFMFQQIAFTAGLVGHTRRSPMPLARHLLALFLLAGLLGFPGADLLAALIEALTGWSPLDELKRQGLMAQASGSLTASFWSTMARGLPTFTGDDLSRRVGEGDFMPKNLRDLKGPWFQKIQNAIRLGEMQADITDQIRNLSPGIGGPLRVYDALQTGVFSSPYRRDAADIETSELTTKDLATMAMGGTPLRLSEAQDRIALLNKDKEKLRRRTDIYLGRIVRAWKANLANEDMAGVAIDRILEEAASKNVIISREQIREALKNATLGREDRVIKTTPRQLREKAYEIAPDRRSENESRAPVAMLGIRG